MPQIVLRTALGCPLITRGFDHKQVRHTQAATEGLAQAGKTNAAQQRTVMGPVAAAVQGSPFWTALLDEFLEKATSQREWMPL